MNAIDSNEFLSSLTQESAAETRPRDELGQDEFLTLMIAQFRNQDPFEPMTNGDFLAQLAQFSTVSGIEDLQSSFSSVAEAITGEQALQAGGLVGKDILTQSEFGRHQADAPLTGMIELEGPARNVEIDLYGESGELVRTISLGEQSAGDVEFAWDGKTLDGDDAPYGTYQLSVRVQRGDFIETIPALVRSEVESVSLGGNRGVLLNTVNAGTLSFSQVDRIL